MLAHRQPLPSPYRHRRGEQGTLPLFILLGMFALTMFLVLTYRQADRSDGRQDPAVGTRIADFSLTTLGGSPREVRLSNLDEDVLLVNFWGTWCPPCKMEIPHLADIAAKLDGRPDFRLVSISCGAGRQENVDTLRTQTRNFLTTNRIRIPHLYADPDFSARSTIFKALNNGGYPTTVVLDRDRVIRGVWVGYQLGDEAAMQHLIEDLLRNGGR